MYVIAITGTTYSDLMNSNYQQDVNLLQLFSDVAVYNDMIGVPEGVLCIHIHAMARSEINV
jgi:thiamine pyrophosphate-dependent acetolactate synthase large subunit-like protein